MSISPEEQARHVKRQYAAQYLGLPEVSGFGIERDDTGQYVITIYVNTKDPSFLQQLPDQIEGYPVRVIQSEPFRAITRTSPRYR